MLRMLHRRTARKRGPTFYIFKMEKATAKASPSIDESWDKILGNHQSSIVGSLKEHGLQHQHNKKQRVSHKLDDELLEMCSKFTSYRGYKMQHPCFELLEEWRSNYTFQSSTW
jgi:hypothetical protein